MEGTALVVEDDPDLRRVLRAVLESRGLAVEEARHGEAALDVVARVTPDVIVTDLQMPLMTGVEFARRFALEPGSHEVPIIAITSDRGPMRETARRSGLFARVLTKPLTPGTFLQAVAAAIGI